MIRRNRIAWKLSVIGVVVVTVVIIVTGFMNILIATHYARESARAVLEFNSSSILKGINKLMMSRNNDAVLELVKDMSSGRTIYRDIRLVSHLSGEVVVSRLGFEEGVLSKDDRTCAMCHMGEDPATTTADHLTEVVAGPNGDRVLNVVSPIRNVPSCQTADCHAHANSGPILGFLQADYALGDLDLLISKQTVHTVLVAVLAIILAAFALWFMLEQTLEKPIHKLVRGIQSLAANNLSFRFRAKREDEIGLVESSFNTMAARIQSYQAELRGAMEYLEGIVENSADIIITVNPEGLIQTFNKGAEQALGYRRQELIGQHIELLFADPRERDVAIARLQDQDNVTNYETRFLTKNKEVRNVLLTLSWLRDREGRPIGTFGISKDITIEKKLREQLIESEKVAAIGRAVTAIQHAIKNMLNTLNGGNYLLRLGLKKENPQRIEQGCGMIDEGVSRIRNLSLKMLEYAREWKVEQESTDLASLIGKVSGDLCHAADERGVRLCTDLTTALSPVLCDPQLIHMALMDIITNALDACALKDYESDETPEVTLQVQVSEDRQYAVIKIRDNGIGMTEEARENIFTPFFSTKEKWGTGLGLAITSRVIDLHRGNITVESEPGCGTVFRIALPLGGPDSVREAGDKKVSHPH
jgi:PAS domain S-box-containing protein